MMLASLLESTIDRELQYLRGLSATQAAQAPKPGAWSPKQELGHLVDSAANNHMRIVRAALEGSYIGPTYAQDAWVEIHGYQTMPWMELIDLWYDQNRLLVHLIKRIPADRLESPCTIGDGAPVGLSALIGDYVLHMQHHLDHLLARETVTRYPQ